MTRIAVNGALGRMGSRIIALAKEQPDNLQVVQTFDLKEAESLLPYVKGEKKLACDVLIDFSGPDGANWSATAAHLSKKAVVIGSTGLDAETMKKIHAVKEGVAVVLSSNMSIGVNVMIQLLESAAQKLGKNFDIKIQETHHVHKKDAPSGTAIMIADAIAKAGAGKRPPIESIREGEIVGDHTVLFSGPDETLEITHRAGSRDIFAHGALEAAKFAAKAKPGLYSMADVLK